MASTPQGSQEVLHGSQVVPRTFHRATASNIAFDLNPFILEWFAGGRMFNQLPISAVCNCHCLFCSNRLNSFPVVEGIFRDIEDIKLQLCAMAANDGPIRLSDSLPGRISEGEALLHPRLFDILDLVRRKFFYNTICFTTNGSLLDEALLKKLSAFRPIEVTLSLHSTIPELWTRIFASGPQAAHTAIAAVPLLKRYGIEWVGTIVPLPRICGWDDLDRTYEFLVANGAKRMILFWPGYTVKTHGALLKELECPLEEFTAYACRMKERFAVPVDPFPDMTAPLQISVNTIIGRTCKGNPKTYGGAYRRVIWLSSRAAFARLETMVAEHATVAPNRHHVVAVENHTYGGNIIASGLLMTEDLIRAGLAALERWPDADLFLVPSTPFDSLLRDLAGTPAYRIAERLGKSVWLAQNNGTIDFLLSLCLLKPRKPLDAALKKAMDLFNLSGSDDAKLETGLDRIDAYPLATSHGLLSRDQLRVRIREDQHRMLGATLASRRFEMLSHTQALCIEIWRLGDSEQPLHRWTRLVNKKNEWLIEGFEEGSPE